MDKGGNLFSKEVRSDREGGDSCDYGPWWESVVAVNIEKKKKQRTPTEAYKL